MDVLVILIPLSVVLALLAAGMLVLMSQHGQFDDLESPGFSVIADDDRNPPPLDVDQGAPAPAAQQSAALNKEHFKP